MENMICTKQIKHCRTQHLFKFSAKLRTKPF